jgi:transcriptional regulator with XRE-family HTH domain
MPAPVTPPITMPRLVHPRLRQVLVQDDLARLAQGDAATIRRLEHGQSHPRPSTLRKLARALGVAPADLMESGA